MTGDLGTYPGSHGGVIGGTLLSTAQAYAAAECEHDWVVYSTAVEDVVILVECAKCQARGYIAEFEPGEWHQAFWAPSFPYGWRDASRVISPVDL